MGGKSYFCDYCDCYMRNDANVRKTHNEGMLHRMNKIRYMRKYEDPRKIYEEEVVKEPCSHFLKGRCRYDLLCQHSHFTSNQLKQLKQMADNLKSKEKQNASALKAVSTAYLLPWNQVDVMQKIALRKQSKKLPPSLKPIKLKKLLKFLQSNNKWGS